MTDDAARYEYPPEWRPRGVQTPTRQTAPKDVLERLRDGELRSGCPNPNGLREPESDAYPEPWRRT
jgi:hypothetical protein